MEPKITKKELVKQLELSQLKFKIAFVVALVAWICLPLVAWLQYRHYHTTALSFKSSPVYTTELPLRLAQPARVSIGDDVQNVPITPADIHDGVWETSDTSATHLSSSSRPGEGGNIVIYAHNRRHLFQPLINVKIDDQVSIMSDDGTEYLYQVTSRQIVTPDQVEVVHPTEYEELTLYTCTGLFDRYRLVLKAKPVGVSKSS